MTQESPVKVPDLTGKTLHEARVAAAVPAGQKPVFSKVSSGGPMDGRVVSQTPLANTPIKPGTTPLLVTLEKSASSLTQGIVQQGFAPSKKSTVVPQLYGDNRELATHLLTAAQLKGTFEGDAAGVVAQQYPLAGKSVDAGSTVTIMVQVPSVIVPSLFAMTETEASRKLDQASLQLGSIFGENSQGSTIVAQSLVAGTHVPRGTSVDVTLRSQPVASAGQQTVTGPPQVVVPNLTAKNSGEVRGTLQEVGLQVGQLTGPSRGVVRSQTPIPGSMVDAHTPVSVTLQVSTVVVPDVVQESENVVVGNLAPTPSWWQTAPWWIWLALGGTVCGVIAIVARIIQTPKVQPASAAPLAVCELQAIRRASRVNFGKGGDARLRFTLQLRDRRSEAAYRFEAEPAVKRKG